MPLFAKVEIENKQTAKLLNLSLSSRNYLGKSMNKINEKGNVAHYSSLKNLANILHDKKLLLSAVANLADPRESSMSWLNDIGYGEGTSQIEWQYHMSAKKVIKDVGYQLKILCTVGESNLCTEGSCEIESSIFGRPRMWAQYGDNSKGFCIVFNKEKLHKAIINLSAKINANIIAGEIEYNSWIHLFNSNITIEHGTNLDPTKIDIYKKMNENGILKNVYFRKGIDWDKENEYRWLLFSESKEPIYVSIEGVVEYVVLGWQFPPNQFSQAKKYCSALGSCPCYCLTYNHPKYSIETL